MNLERFIRRSAAAFLLTAGLAYPACAAVCPKGIGGCTSPGRCFLFTDGDGNSLCDYTGRIGTSAPAGQALAAPARTPAPVQTTVAADTTQAVAEPAMQVTQAVPPVNPGSVSPDAVTAMTPSGNVTSGNVTATVVWSVPVTAVILFVVFAGIFYALFRSGIAGIRIDRALPALGLSSFLALGCSLMATSVVTGSSVASTSFALVYMTAGTLITTYLWHSGLMIRRVVLPIVLMSALTGFVFLAPIMPLEIGGLINVLSGVSPLSAGIVGILAVIALALVAGRTFCAGVCPVGSIQELAYAIPVKKVPLRSPTIAEIIRLAVFAAAVIAAAYLIDILAFTGLYDLFSLTITASFVVAGGILVASAFLYRPVCRFLCPFGVLFSIPAGFSRFRIRRTEACVDCGRCEQACPTHVAGRRDPKRECYLCGRCSDACRVKGALVYG